MYHPLNNPRSVSEAQLAADFETFGAVVNTDLLSIEPAYDDAGTTISQAKTELQQILTRMRGEGVRLIERAERARVRMEELR